MEKQETIDKTKIYEIIKDEILKYAAALHSETYGIEKLDFKEIINIEEILDLILNGERKGIRLLPYIELLGIDFKNQDITYINFTDTNATINPQTVKGKNFDHAILNGLDFKGYSWDGVRLSYTNFTGAKNIDLNPEKVMYPSLYGCILNGIDFKGKAFKGVGLEHADFRGAKNVVIKESEVWNRNLTTTLFDDEAKIIRKREEETPEEKLRAAVLKKILKQIPKCP